MEQNNQWADERLAKLDPDSNWHPNVTAALARAERQRPRKKFIGRWPRMLSVAALALICLSMFPAPRALADRVITPCVEACENLVLSPTDLHYHLDRLLWSFHSWMGLSAPDFEATDASGANFQLSDYSGKVVLLNFWASWCAPCQKEIPWLVELQRKYGDQGFAVIGISMDEDGWKAVRPAMESQKINYRVAIGDDALAKKYGSVQSLPETLLIYRDGRILTRVQGGIVGDKSQYERLVVRTLWSRLSQTERDRLRAEGFH
jgi:cytochrome c biogenesis protein CcmG/thiol:disulfide interchange protein DsbE